MKNHNLPQMGEHQMLALLKTIVRLAELGIRNQTLHQIDEFVYLKDLEDLEKIYLKILENYFIKN